jgi:hypothetical protein
MLQGLLAAEGSKVGRRHVRTLMRRMGMQTVRGFTNVVGLKKDSDGVWRGTATQGGKSVKVSVDFQGNVVSQ